MNRWQYLFVMGLCLIATLPLEIALGSRVYRQAPRLALTLLCVAGPFVAWDAIAIARHHWRFSDRYTTGWTVPGAIPIEEIVFFVVVPICAILTYETVRRIVRKKRA